MPEGLLPTLPTIPTVRNTHGDILGQFQPRRFDPLAEYGPSVEEIQARVNQKESENKRGLLWDILAIPDKIAGQTIKGFVRGLGEDGIGGALEGAARGSAPAFLSDWLLGTNFSRETTAVDIRKAWGDQSEQVGAANFLINLGIDAALDPVAWLLTPFGKTAQGAAKAIQAAEEIRTATLAAKAAGGALPPAAITAIQDAFRVSASIQKAVDVGDRAAFVLKLPFAKTPFFETNLGFKSMSLGIGKAIDSTMMAVRNGPLGDMIRQVKVDYVKAADPDTAAQLSRNMARGLQANREIVAMAQAKAMEYPEVFDFMANNPQIHGAMTTIAEADIPSVDARAQLSSLADAPDLVLRSKRLETRLATDKTFKSIYDTATSVKADDIAFVAAQKGANLGSYEDKAVKAYDALNTLYRKYDLPIPSEYLQAAGLPERTGVEISAFRAAGAERTTATEIALAHPGSLSAGEASRAAVDSATPNAAMEARQSAIDQLRQDFADILALPDADRAKLDKWLEIHKFMMKEQARIEAVNGVMNASFEHHVGPYVYRIATPDTKKFINDFARSKINSIGPAGIAVSERFMKNREWTDLLAIEANAVAWEVGTKATGYAPLKTLMAEHGHDGFFGWLFDKPFIRDLWKKDPEAAQFFSVNPVHSDYQRIVAGARAVGKMTMLRGLIDSTMKKTTTKLSDIADNQNYTAKGMIGVMEVGTPGRPYRTVSPQEIIQEGVSAEVAARYEIADAMIGRDLHARLRVDGANFNAEMAGLKDALNITHKMSPRDLAQSTGESYAASNMKGAAREIQDAQGRFDTIRELERSLGKGPLSEAATAKMAEYGRRWNTDSTWASQFADERIGAEIAAIREDIKRAHVGNVSEREAIRLKALDEQARMRQQILTVRKGAKERIADVRELNLSRRGKELSGYVPKLSDNPLYVQAKERAAASISVRREEIGRIGEAAASRMEESVQGASKIIRAKMDRIDELVALRDSLSDRAEWLANNIRLDREEAQAALSEAHATYAAVRRGVQENIRQFGDTSRDVAAMMKGSAAEERALLSAQRGAGLTPSKFNQELVLWHRLRKDGRLAYDEAQNFVMSDGSKLIDKLPQDGTVHWFDRKEFESAVAQIDEVYKPDMLRDSRVAKVLDYVKSVWAPYTTVNPLFLQSRVRDQATNFLQLSLNGFRHFGVIPEAINTRMALHRSLHGGAEAGALDAVAVTRTLADGTIESMTRRQLLDITQAKGVVTGQSMMASDMMDTAEAFASRHPPATATNVLKGVASAFVPFQPGMNSPVIRWGAKFAGVLDDTARLAGFMDAWKRRMSIEQAVEHVSSTLYSGLRASTSLERSILQRTIPFYGFAKWAMGQSVKTYFEKPGFLDVLGKVRDNAYASPPFGGNPIDPAQVDTILPQFLKDGLGIPYRNSPEGPRFFALGGYLPIGEISQLVAGLQGMFDPKSTNGMLAYVASKMNPALKVPLEAFLNRDMFKDRDIEAVPGEQRNFMGMTVNATTYQLMSQIRFVSELGRLGILTRDQAKAIVAAQESGEKPIGEREQLPFMDRFIGSAFGFAPKTYLVDVANDSLQARAKQDDEIQQAKSLLKSNVLRQEGSPASKENIQAIRTVLADKYADRALLSQELEQYSVDERLQRKALRSRDKAQLSVLRSRPGG